MLCLHLLPVPVQGSSGCLDFLIDFDIDVRFIWNCLFFSMWTIVYVSPCNRLVACRVVSQPSSYTCPIVLPMTLKRIHQVDEYICDSNFLWQRFPRNVTLMIGQFFVSCSASHEINKCWPASCSAPVISMEFTCMVTHYLISFESNSGTVLIIYSWNMVYIILMLM